MNWIEAAKQSKAISVALVISKIPLIGNVYSSYYLPNFQIQVFPVSCQSEYFQALCSNFEIGKFQLSISVFQYFKTIVVFFTSHFIEIIDA